MQIKQLDHINMTVANLEESLDWYRRTFGFEEVERGVYQGQPWSIVKSGEAMLCLYEAPERLPLERLEHTTQKGHRVSHFAFRIDDRAAWEQTVEDNDVELHYGGAVSWPNSTSWYVQDPSGHEIEVALWRGNEITF